MTPTCWCGARQADFFEAVGEGPRGKAAANWVINELFGRLNKDGRTSRQPGVAEPAGAIVDLIASGAISGKIAKDLFEIVWSEGGDPRRDRRRARHEAGYRHRRIEAAVDAMIAANPDKVAAAKAKPPCSAGSSARS